MPQTHKTFPVQIKMNILYVDWSAGRWSVACHMGFIYIIIHICFTVVANVIVGLSYMYITFVESLLARRCVIRFMQYLLCGALCKVDIGFCVVAEWYAIHTPKSAMMMQRLDRKSKPLQSSHTPTTYVATIEYFS